MTGTTGTDQARQSPVTVTGAGSLEQLPELLDQVGGRAAMLVVGPGTTPVAERARSLLGHRWIGNFTDAVAHVPSWQVNLAVASAQEIHADSVIAIGGGSAAGYAKIVALALRLPWIAVPTTLSGAEMTSRYLVTTGEGKEMGRSHRAAARAIIRDPELLDLVPIEVLASSGMTAVAACLESLAKGTSDVQAMALRGLRGLWSTLPMLLIQPRNTELRLCALKGAALAGSALELAGPGPAQLVAEDLGARHRCDHGSLLACLLPRVVRPVRAFTELSGDDAAARVKRFVKTLGLPVELSRVCPYPDIDELVGRLADRPDLAEHVNIGQLLKPVLGIAA